jgi:hypothetical protein
MAGFGKMDGLIVGLWDFFRGKRGERKRRFSTLCLLANAQDESTWTLETSKTALKGLFTEGEENHGLLPDLKLAKLEGLLLRVSTDNYLPELLDALQDEYRRLFCKDKDLPAIATNQPKNKDAIRETLIVLALRVHKLRAARQILATTRFIITVAASTLVFVVGLAAFRRFPSGGANHSQLLLLAVSGSFGALVSSLQRLYGLTAADVRWFPPNFVLVFVSMLANQLLSIFEGWIFAVVLLLIFVGKLVQTSAASQFDISSLTDCKTVCIALVFGFAAGFSERLVPDLIDRISTKPKA